MSALAPGAVLDGRFRLVAPLGGGGAATVWQAHDAATDAQVAVKLLHPKFRAHAGVRARLAQEARLLAEFEHPHLARALAFALEAEVPYFVLELVRGVSLEEALAERAPAGWVALQDALQILGQVASAVDYAHARGVVHRDLKPANIMLAPEGAKVLDFGIAKLLEVSDPSFATTQGRVLGSGFYMAPEQALDTAAVSPQADVFALGTVAFELLTSRRAWVEGPDGGPVAAFAEALPNTERNRLGAVLARMLDAPRPRACALRPELPRAVDEVLGRAMAPLPEGRFATAGAFFEALAAAVGPAGALQGDLPDLPDTFVRAGLPETLVRERAGLEDVPDTLVRAGAGLEATVVREAGHGEAEAQAGLRAWEGPVLPQALDLDGPEPGRTPSAPGEREGEARGGLIEARSRLRNAGPGASGWPTEGHGGPPAAEPASVVAVGTEGAPWTGAGVSRGVPGWVWGVGGVFLGLLLAAGWGAVGGGFGAGSVSAGQLAPAARPAASVEAESRPTAGAQGGSVPEAAAPGEAPTAGAQGGPVPRAAALGAPVPTAGALRGEPGSSATVSDLAAPQGASATGGSAPPAGSRSALVTGAPSPGAGVGARASGQALTSKTPSGGSAAADGPEAQGGLPASAGATAAARRRPPSSQPSGSTEPGPAAAEGARSPERARMDSLVARLRRDPQDLQALGALSAALEGAAASVPDPGRRQRIQRLAAAAALTGRPDPALEAYDLLEAE